MIGYKLTLHLHLHLHYSYSYAHDNNISASQIQNDFLQTERIKQLDKYSTSIKYRLYFIQLFAFKHKPQTFSRVCLRFITWHLPFETRRHKVYCLKIIKTEPVYTCKKRLLISFVALLSFENLYKLLLQNVGMFRIKIDKTCIKTWQLQQQNRWVSHSN